MTYAEKVKKEFIWSIKTSRLITATLKMNVERKPKAEAEKTNKAEALGYIEQAQGHCSKMIAEDLAAEAIDKEQAEQGRKALEAISQEAAKQAERLQA